MIRASIFWLQYAPKVYITERAKENNIISDEDERLINEGKQDNYLSTGSPMEAERKRILKTYHILYRLLPITPHRGMMWLLDSGAYKIFRFIPFQIPVIILADLLMCEGSETVAAELPPFPPPAVRPSGGHDRRSREEARCAHGK